MSSTQALHDGKIQLNAVEETLKRLLLDVAQYINPEKPSQLRFTGGWVRDKLLGVGSHDVDIGINDMTGETFGLKMKEYLEIPGNPEKYGLLGVATSEEEKIDPKTVDRSKLVHGLHKIKANPEKSKNLETATTKIFGLDIDLVNLRKETYSEESRNPQMEFGTPYEDAERRDATINSMFYNLQDDKVEDLTGRGLEDLKNKIIRTPLPPYQTFRDDPLRVLRLIRFSSRLAYSIDPEAEMVMKDESIKHALKLKISRERIGVELEKMLRGPNPLRALTLIDELGLYNTIFADPTTNSPYTPDVTSWHDSYQFAVDVLNHDQSALQSLLFEDDESRYLTLLLSAFVPWADAPELAPAKPGSKIPPPRAALVARECIKATNKVCDVVGYSVQHLEDITTTKDNYINRKRNIDQATKDHNPCGPDTLGMAIRRWGSTWRSQVVFAMIVEHSRRPDSDRDIVGEYTALVSQMDSLGLMSAYDLKPVIDGKALAAALDTKPGPWMKDALEVVMAWQLRSPENATAEGAIEAVRNKHGELTDSLIRHFLQLTIRPLFSKQQTHNVTAQGRKATDARDHRRRHEMDEEKPWKDPRNAFALELLSWTIQNLDSHSTEEHWPMLIPPLFALVDDIDVDFKAKGCRFLTHLFSVTSPAMMKRTGLGEVFQDALDPCLSYLPTLTPENESILLLGEAFPAIIALIKLRHHTDTSSISEGRIRALSELLHEHILPSVLHLEESHPRITVLLLRQIGIVVDELGIHATAHSVHVLPLIASITTSPFTVAHPPLLLAAMNVLQVVIANIWPRAFIWRGEILKAVCACWLQVVEEEERSGGNIAENELAELEATKAAARRALEMLRSAVEATAGELDDGGIDLQSIVDADTRRVRDADPRLGGLLLD